MGKYSTKKGNIVNYKGWNSYLLSYYMLNILLTKKITHNKTGKKKKKKMRLRNLWVKSNITIAPKSWTFNFVTNNKQSKSYPNTIMVRWLTNDFIYLFIWFFKSTFKSKHGFQTEEDYVLKILWESMAPWS